MPQLEDELEFLAEFEHDDDEYYDDILDEVTSTAPTSPRFSIGDEVRIVSNGFPDDPAIQSWFSSRLSIGAVGRVTHVYHYATSFSQWEYEVVFDGYESDGGPMYQTAYDVHLERIPKVRKKSGISQFWSKHGI